MKKCIGLLTVLFVFMPMTFAQNSIGTTDIYLNDGVSALKSDGFTVAVNPDISGHPEMTGTMTIMFDDILDFTQFTHRNSVGIISAVTKFQLPNGGVYGIEFNYDGLVPDSYATVDYNPNTVFPDITEQDTIDAYNNGVASVDTQSFYDNGFTAGVASIDTTTIWNNGYDVGHSEGYDAGYTDGANSATSNKSTYVVNNLNVYPNPATTSDIVTVDSENFNNVKVLSISGQEVYQSFENRFSVNEFTDVAGVFILQVEDNELNTKVMRLLVQ